MKRLREVVLIVFGLLGILALARQALEPDALGAVAIPNAQEPLIAATQQDFETGLVQTTSTSFVPVPNTSVTINNGSRARNVVVTFSAEALGNGFTTLELGYSLDGAGCFQQAGGPTDFSASQTNFGAATAVHVIPLGTGAHTIQACFRSDTGNFVYLKDRTLIAEGRTK